LDGNVAIIHDHLLLRSVHESTSRSRLCSKLLDGFHHISGLGEKRVAKLGGPVEVLIQPLQEIGVARERLDAIIPGLIRDLRRIAVSAHIARRENDVGGNG
jgi:hypothetical protein